MRLSVGADEATLAHGDFFDAWKRSALRNRVRDCLVARSSAAPTGSRLGERRRQVPALEIRGLTKRYDDGTLALEGLDLEVPAGEFFGLLGPNGAGKTTLIGAVCNLIRITEGEVLVFGRPAVEPRGAADARGRGAGPEPRPLPQRARGARLPRRLLRPHQARVASSAPRR